MRASERKLYLMGSNARGADRQKIDLCFVLEEPNVQTSEQLSKFKTPKAFSDNTLTLENI